MGHGRGGVGTFAGSAAGHDVVQATAMLYGPVSAVMPSAPMMCCSGYAGITQGESGAGDRIELYD